MTSQVGLGQRVRYIGWGVPKRIVTEYGVISYSRSVVDRNLILRGQIYVLTYLVDKHIVIVQIYLK